MSFAETKKKNKALKSKWVWAVFGLFGIVFVVNFGFISAALNTNPGLVTEEYYKYGLQQNKFDKQFRTQVARGWNVQLMLGKDWHINQPQLVRLVVTDKYSQPVSGAHAELSAYRPSDAKADIATTLVEDQATGVYQAEISLPIQGVWDMNLLLSKGDDEHLLNQRINIQGEGEAEPSTLEKIVSFILPE